MPSFNNIPLNLRPTIAQLACQTRAGREVGFNGVRSHQNIILGLLMMGREPTNAEKQQLKFQHETAIRNIADALQHSLDVQRVQYGRGNVGRPFLNERQNQMIRLLNGFYQNYPGGLTVNKLMNLTGMTRNNALHYLKPIRAATRLASLRSLNPARRRVRR